MRREARAWLCVVAGSFAACARTTTLSPRYEPGVTPDLAYQRRRTDAPLPPEGLVPVLVPAGVTLFHEGSQCGSGIASSWCGREEYVGPARVFVPAGRRVYDVFIDDDGDRSVVPISIELRAGHAYGLELTLTGEHVEWALIPLCPDGHARRPDDATSTAAWCPALAAPGDHSQ